MTRDPWEGLFAGRVLDVATGKGAFLAGLLEDLGSYSEIVGVDVDQNVEKPFLDRFGTIQSVRFVCADANSLPFQSESFDTVALGGSLHHVSQPRLVLSEMLRVLAPGGALVIAEQLHDGQRGPSLTHRQFHEWSEQLLSIARPTYTRAELVELLEGLDLPEISVVDQHDRSDPHDAAKVARYDAFIEKYLDKSEGRKALVARGTRIRARLHATGINVASWVSVLGRKRRS